MSEKLQQTPSSPESVRYKIDELLVKIRGHMDVLDFHERMLPFAKKIRDNCPDYEKYRCYHQLIGSDIGEKGIIRGEFEGLFEDKKVDENKESNFIEKDFEGEYSVVEFLQKMLKTGV